MVVRNPHVSVLFFSNLSRLCLSRTNFHLLILITATPMRTQHARAQTDMKINTRRKGCCSMPPSNNKEMGQKMLALQIKVRCNLHTIIVFASFSVSLFTGIHARTWD